jgi:anti-sigma factor RsiW
MPQVPLCPHPRDLLRLTLGLVPELEAEPLGQHLLSCPRCADRLNNLQAKDTLIEALRGSQDTQPADLPAVEALMDRLARMPPPALTLLTVQTSEVSETSEVCSEANPGHSSFMANRLGTGSKS